MEIINPKMGHMRSIKRVSKKVSPKGLPYFSCYIDNEPCQTVYAFYDYRVKQESYMRYQFDYDLQWIQNGLNCSYCKKSIEYYKIKLPKIRLGKKERCILLKTKYTVISKIEPVHINGTFARSDAESIRRPILKLYKIGLLDIYTRKKRRAESLTPLGFWVKKAIKKQLINDQPIRWEKILNHLHIKNVPDRADLMLLYEFINEQYYDFTDKYRHFLLHTYKRRQKKQSIEGLYNALDSFRKEKSSLNIYSLYTNACEKTESDLTIYC